MTKHELPDLTYDYNALEPVIDERTMKVHHTKHHQGYTDKLNKALKKHEEHKGHEAYADLPVEKLLEKINTLPESLQEAVQQNGGGYVNHNLFFSILSPEEKRAHGDIKEAIEKVFGDIDTFKQDFANKATSRFGSGWAWLVLDEEKNLEIIDTPNQDSPYMYGKTPLIGIDVWEHAYYLNYQNRRADYVKAVLEMLDWDEIERRYQDAK